MVFTKYLTQCSKYNLLLIPFFIHSQFGKIRNVYVTEKKQYCNYGKKNFYIANLKEFTNRMKKFCKTVRYKINKWDSIIFLYNSKLKYLIKITEI